MSNYSTDTKKPIRFFGYADKQRKDVEKYISKMKTRLEELKTECPNLDNEYSLIYSTDDMLVRRKLKVAKFFKNLKLRIELATRTVTNPPTKVDKYPYILYYPKQKKEAVGFKKFVQKPIENQVNPLHMKQLNQLANLFQKKHEETKAEKQNKKKVVEFKKYVREVVRTQKFITTEVNPLHVKQLNQLANLFQKKHKETKARAKKQNQVEKKKVEKGKQLNQLANIFQKKHNETKAKKQNQVEKNKVEKVTKYVQEPIKTQKFITTEVNPAHIKSLKTFLKKKHEETKVEKQNQVAKKVVKEVATVAHTKQLNQLANIFQKKHNETKEKTKNLNDLANLFQKKTIYSKKL